MEIATDIGGGLVQIKDSNGEPGPWIPRARWDAYQARQGTTTPQYGSTSEKEKYASGKQQELALEMLDYVRENQPLMEPTGAAGKLKQVEWRKERGLAYIDPMTSSLSTWTSCLAANGLIRQTANGLWVAIEGALVPERLQKPSKRF